MSELFNIKRNDTGPSIAGILERPSGTAVNISGATVRFKMRDASKASVVNAVATVFDGSAGSVRYDWDAADTEDAGLFEAEWEVTYSDSTIETFPNDGFIPVYITEDI
jgi:hypothetical protein